MRLYLDDDSVSPALVRLLRQAGHDVVIPIDRGLAGANDPLHLARAIREERVCLTCNYGHFGDLHELIMQAHGHHPGILIVRQDNDARDMRPWEIVKAIGKLQAAAIPLADEIIVLNQWR